MDENNQEMSAPKQPTKEEKATQAGKDLAEVAATGAGNALGGPIGGMIANRIAQTKLGQNVLNTAGKALASNPFTKNALAKAQPAVQQAKPMLNQAAGNLGGGAGGAIGANQSVGSSNNGPTNSNPSTSSSNNSGFGNNKSGLFSPKKSTDESQSDSVSTDLGKSFKKASKAFKIIGMISPILFPMIICAVIAFVVMGQIMIVWENIQDLVQQFTTGIEKFGNLLQGDGWATEEESFFNHLNNEYENFQLTVNDGQLDIALISATIHYSTTVDLNEFEGSDDANTESETSIPTIGTLDKQQTVAFYNDAKYKVGKVNTIWPGQKRLLGHIVKTEITIEMIDVNAAGGYWANLFHYLGQTFFATAEDAYWNTPLKYTNPLGAIADFIETFNRATKYVEEKGNLFYELDYDAANLWYEAQEFVNTFQDLFDKCIGSTTMDANGNLVAKEDQNGWFRVPAPVLIRTMNYGYDEYKQMQRDLLEMRAILTNNGVEVANDSEVLKNAETSSNTELKKLYEDYRKQEDAYEYSYTHYLRNVYVPFNFCYRADCSLVQIDTMIDEIFDQRDFYYYLMGDEAVVGSKCGYSYSGDPVSIEVNTEMLNNLYVNVLNYEEVWQTSTDIAETVSLKDYVLGVLYREMDLTTSTNPEYIKANIIAIKSYTMERPNQMGNPITNDGQKYFLTMRNNQTEQLYCNLAKGCMDAPSHKKEAPSQELIDYISKLYDDVANKFLYDGENKKFVGDYREKDSECIIAGITGRCMGQDSSKELGEAGNNWETILANFYINNIGIVDISTSTLSTSVLSCITPGLQLGHSGYSIRTTAPTSGSKYFTPPLNASTLGQCAWYAKGRALEIVDTVNASPEKKDKALATIKSIFANGNQWYHDSLIEVFAHSTDYTLPREGAIVVYDWVYPDEKGNRYGHVAIVEKVEGDLVYVSDGWNSCGGAYGEASWNCVGFGYRALTIEQMQNMGRPEKYKFIGYVYLLD